MASTAPSKDAATLEPGRAATTRGLADYAEGAIVSRTIAKNKAGTITFFAFDAQQELSEHTAPFDAFVHVVDGQAVLTIDGKAVEVSTGEIALMPAHVPHAVRADERFKMVLTMLRDPASGGGNASA